MSRALLMVFIYIVLGGMSCDAWKGGAPDIAVAYFALCIFAALLDFAWEQNKWRE